MNPVVLYLIVINIVTLLLYAADKAKAVHHKWRIPERVLLGSAAVGGSAGALAGMLLFRHKIRKARFMIGVPVILMMQILLAEFLMFR